MHVEFDILNDEICFWLPVHDPVTNTNWIAELHGTFAEIVRFGSASAKLMDEAGFIPRWCATGSYCGSIDYIALVRVAVERCRPTPLETTADAFYH